MNFIREIGGWIMDKLAKALVVFVIVGIVF